MKLLLLLSLLTIVACTESEKSEVSICHNKGGFPMDKLDGRPAYLVVGDSISIAYTPHLQSLITDKQVVHNDCNARHSRNGVQNISKWSSKTRWEVCTLNHGLWDAVDMHGVSQADYVANLEVEIDVLQARCDKVLFITTTSIPVNFDQSNDAEVITLNTLATNLMNSKGVPVCDLHTISSNIDHLRYFPDLQNDVHFISEGSRLFADEIKRCIDLL